MVKEKHAGFTHRGSRITLLPFTPYALLIITKPQLDEIYAHCLSRRPNEACGLLLGRDDGRVVEVKPARNVLESPTRYAVDPLEHLHALRDAEAKGLEVIGVYHSHVKTEAYPSATDIEAAEEAQWDVDYLIVSLARNRSARVFRIADGSVTEEKLNVVD